MNSIPTNPARQSDKDSESMQGGTLEIRASALNNSSRLNGEFRQRQIVAFRPEADARSASIRQFIRRRFARLRSSFLIVVDESERTAEIRSRKSGLTVWAIQISTKYHQTAQIRKSDRFLSSSLQRETAKCRRSIPARPTMRERTCRAA